LKYVGLFTVSSYPFDTMSKRLQMQSMYTKENSLFRGYGDLILKVDKKEGLNGFYRGFSVYFLKFYIIAYFLLNY
jgi:hypothetical protein